MLVRLSPATVALAALAAGSLAGAALAQTQDYQGSTFADVWSKTKEGPYLTLPEHKTFYETFFDGGANLLSSAANRTLGDQEDVLPRFQKLVHPIGICFSGTWQVSEANPYSGYFAKGAKGLIIVRASEAMGNPDVGDWRAFGFAGKIFPTTDVNDRTLRKTANFFTVDDLGGAAADSFLDDAKTNAPKTSFHLSQLAIFPTLTEIARVFATADSNPGVRQVYPIAELGLADAAQAVTPKAFMVQAETPQRTAASDFRQELRLANYPEGLTFGIFVGEDPSSWTRIGAIHLTEEALADGCDHQLHFHHPPSK